MINIECYKQIHDIPLDRDSWNALVAQNQVSTPFQTFEWFHSWWDSFGDQYELFFLVARQEDTILAFAPLMLATEAYNRRVVRFTGDQNADYCDFVIRGNRLQIIECFFDFLYSRQATWTRMTLLNIPAYSSTRACIETIAAAHRYHVQIKSPVSSPALVIRHHLDYATSCANKYSMSRHLKKLEKEGSVSLVNYYSKPDIDRYLDNFFDQHIKRYGSKGIVSQFNEPSHQHYFRKLVEQFDDTGWLVFSVLKFNELPIAYHFGFRYDNKLIWYKPSFNIDYAGYSPGSIMLKKLIEYAINSSCDELDFSVGDEAFKSRFSNQVRQNNNISIYRHRITLDFYLLRQLAGKIINFMKTRMGSKR